MSLELNLSFEAHADDSKPKKKVYGTKMNRMQFRRELKRRKENKENKKLRRENPNAMNKKQRKEFDKNYTKKNNPPKGADVSAGNVGKSEPSDDQQSAPSTVDATKNEVKTKTDAEKPAEIPVKSKRAPAKAIESSDSEGDDPPKIVAKQKSAPVKTPTPKKIVHKHEEPKPARNKSQGEEQILPKSAPVKAPTPQKIVHKHDEPKRARTESKGKEQVDSQRHMKRAQSGNRHSDGGETAIPKKRKKPSSGKEDQGDGSKKNPGDHAINRLFKDLVDCESIEAPQNVSLIHEQMFDENKFENLDPPLHPYLVKNLTDEGKSVMTRVQREALPPALEGKDLLVKAQTGSGKTMVYALPILHSLGSRLDETKVQRADGPYAIVICPTRELSMQSFETIEPLLMKTFNWIIPGIVNGGISRKTEKRTIRKGINILIGTPGRLYDHIRQTDSLKLDNVEFLVVDEADRLFEQTFELQVREIIQKVQNESKAGEKLQTLLLSATLSAGVETLAGMTLKNPITIDLAADAVTLNADDYKSLENEQYSLPKELTQLVCFTPLKLRFLTLVSLVKSRLQAREKTVVFFSCIEEVKFFYKVLVDADLFEGDASERILSLHGDMPQERRKGVYAKFKEADDYVLLSTDVTERGLHFNNVNWIIQYNPAPTIRGYVHRVGRTARVGASGKSIVIMSPEQKVYLEILAKSGIGVHTTSFTDVMKEAFPTDSEQKSREEAASIQRRYENYVNDPGRHSVKGLAVDTYVQFLRSYATCRMELGFVAKDLHFGHLAKTFGLIDPPKELVAARKDLKAWVKNGIHHGSHALHRRFTTYDAKLAKQHAIDQATAVATEPSDANQDTDSPAPKPAKKSESVNLLEEDYQSRKEKDHSKGARAKLHFDEIDKARFQRVEQKRRERKDKWRKLDIDGELDKNRDAEPEDRNKPLGKLIKLDTADKRRAKMQKQLNRARIVQRDIASEFASSMGKANMAKRR